MKQNERFSGCIIIDDIHKPDKAEVEEIESFYKENFREENDIQDGKVYFTRLFDRKTDNEIGFAFSDQIEESKD